MRRVIKFLETYDDAYQKQNQKVQQLTEERDELLVRIRELESEYPKLITDDPATAEQIATDAETLMKILDRSRRLLLRAE